MKEVRVCEAMKSPVGTLSMERSCISKMEGPSPDKSDLGKEQSDAGRSCGLLWHWHQQTA